MQTSEFFAQNPDQPLLIPLRTPSPDIIYPYPLFKQDEDLKRSAMKPNQVSTVILHGVRIVCLSMDGKERLCLAQISNTLLKDYSYNEIHNRRVALGITCVQCTPVQLEILRRAGAMPISSRRCGMITKREAERLCKSFLGDNTPPKLPDNFAFEVYHECAWGCRGQFVPTRYNSSRAKCIKCHYCGVFFSPNKFVFHSHRLTDSDKYVQPDAANFNSWRRHTKLLGDPPEAIVHAWEDVKAMFNGGTRKRMFNESSASHNSRPSVATPTSTTSAPPTPPNPASSKPSRSKVTKMVDKSGEKKPSILPTGPPPSLAPPPYFATPPFESCLDTFAAALNPNLIEKQPALKIGGNGGEIPGDYGLWPSPPNHPTFPFPYPFFWPSKRPQSAASFAPFHSSSLFATPGVPLLKDEDLKLMKESSSVLQWMERRRRSFFLEATESAVAASASAAASVSASSASNNPIFPGLDSDLYRRNFSAFRPVAKIGDFLQLSSPNSKQDSGETCEVSTTVDKDQEDESSSKKMNSDEVIDVETEEKVKSEPQDFSVRKIVNA